MQFNRDYVPEWMEIRGCSIGASVKHNNRGISILIQWHDKRGSLVRQDCGEIKPISIPTYWTEDHWSVGLEGLIKMTISEDARLWEGMVTNQMAIGAYWQPEPH